MEAHQYPEIYQPSQISVNQEQNQLPTEQAIFIKLMDILKALGTKGSRDFKNISRDASTLFDLVKKIDEKGVADVIERMEKGIANNSKNSSNKINWRKFGVFLVMKIFLKNISSSDNASRAMIEFFNIIFWKHSTNRAPFHKEDFKIVKKKCDECGITFPDETKSKKRNWLSNKEIFSPAYCDIYYQFLSKIEKTSLKLTESKSHLVEEYTDRKGKKRKYLVEVEQTTKIKEEITGFLERNKIDIEEYKQHLAFMLDHSKSKLIRGIINNLGNDAPSEFLSDRKTLILEENNIGGVVEQEEQQSFEAQLESDNTGVRTIDFSPQRSPLAANTVFQPDELEEMFELEDFLQPEGPPQ